MRFQDKSPVKIRCRGGAAGYLLMETVIALSIVVVLFVMIVNSYMQTGMRAEWTGYALAAQSLSSQPIDIARSAPWDPSNTTTNPGEGITNLVLQGKTYSSTPYPTWTGYTNQLLNVPYIGTNVVMATNYVMVQKLIVANITNCNIYLVRVDTVWPFFMRGAKAYFTNTTITMMAPDNSVPPGQIPTGSQ